MFKYSGIALVLGSNMVFAGVMGSICTVGNVSVPCTKQAWKFGVTALYLKPYSAVEGWAGISANDVVSTTTNNLSETYIENNLDWRWGFKLEGAYRFNGGNDLNLNWYHLGQKKSATTFTDKVTTFRRHVMDTHVLSFKPSWDAVNLQLGQYIDVDDQKNIHIHGGVQYVRIKTIYSTSGAATTVPTVTQHDVTASFNGLGPRIGADLFYGLFQGLSMYANGAGALLLGTSKFNDVYTTNHGFNQHANGSKSTLTFETEATLGFTYAHAMVRSNATLDIGYMWAHYTAPNIIREERSDFAVQGPFVGAKWIGNI